MMLGRLVGLAARHPWRLLAAVLAATATVLAGVGLMTSSGYLISAAALRPPILDLLVVLVAVRFFGISRAVVRYVERWVAHDTTFRLLLELRVWFYDRIEPLAPVRLQGVRSGDLLSRMVGDVERLQEVYLRVVTPVVVAGLVTMVVCGGLAWWDWRLALATGGFLWLHGMAVPLGARRWARGWGRAQVTLRSEVNALLVDRLQGVQEVLAFGLEEDSARRLGDLDDRLARLQRQQAWVTGLQEGLGHLSAWAGLGAILWLAIPLVTGGQLSGVALAALALGVLSSFEAVQNLGGALQHLEASQQSAARLFEIIDQPPPVQSGWQPMPKTHEIAFEQVTFAYAGEPVLRSVDFRVPRGGKVAVVGPSGGGKSTLIRLLVRFQDPGQGRITLGGTDLRRLDPEALRRRLAVLAQEAHLFDTTVRRNLLLARPDATESELIGALERAGMGAWLRALPDGLETWCEEGGTRFSGGERRRLSLAQAILKAAPVLVLDEPLANLDGIQEQRLLDTIAGLAGDPSLLMVTHRLIRMEFWDEILVLQGGRIAQRGKHAELLRQEGWYRRMVLGAAKTVW